MRQQHPRRASRPSGSSRRSTWPSRSAGRGPRRPSTSPTNVAERRDEDRPGDRLMTRASWSSAPTGMLGHEAIRVLAAGLEVWGACRDPRGLPDLGIPEERHPRRPRRRPDTRPLSTSSTVRPARRRAQRRRDRQAARGGPRRGPLDRGEQPVAARARRGLRERRSAAGPHQHRLRVQRGARAATPSRTSPTSATCTGGASCWARSTTANVRDDPDVDRSAGSWAADGPGRLVRGPSDRATQGLHAGDLQRSHDASARPRSSATWSCPNGASSGCGTCRPTRSTRTRCCVELADAARLGRRPDAGRRAGDRPLARQLALPGSDRLAAAELGRDARPARRGVARETDGRAGNSAARLGKARPPAAAT